uniref:Uncharacterized protein n=1 Tax=Micrurus surinamensis TaxID=129470 RepID=A0A2D4PY09_MICSU
MKKNYPGAVSAMKMPVCAATAVMMTSIVSAASGKAMMSMIGRSTEHLAIVLPASKNEPKEQDGNGLKKASARNVFHCASAGHKNQLWIPRKEKPILGKNKQLQ